MLDIMRYKKAKEAGTVRLVKIGSMFAAIYKAYDRDTGVSADEKQEFSSEEVDRTIADLTMRKDEIASQIAVATSILNDAKKAVNLLEEKEDIEI